MSIGTISRFTHTLLPLQATALKPSFRRKPESMVTERWNLKHPPSVDPGFRRDDDDVRA
jgi:hypothetical protein